MTLRFGTRMDASRKARERTLNRGVSREKDDSNYGEASRTNDNGELPLALGLRRKVMK